MSELAAETRMRLCFKLQQMVASFNLLKDTDAIKLYCTGTLVLSLIKHELYLLDNYTHLG